MLYKMHVILRLNCGGEIICKVIFHFNMICFCESIFENKKERYKISHVIGVISFL
jgi:hypothetical protein